MIFKSIDIFTLLQEEDGTRGRGGGDNEETRPEKHACPPGIRVSVDTQFMASICAIKHRIICLPVM